MFTFLMFGISFTNPATGTVTTGLAGANAMCMYEAEIFGLTTGAAGAPVFKAWLSTTATSPAGSGSQAFNKSTGKYVIVSNDAATAVAASFSALTTSGAAAAVNTTGCGNEDLAGATCASAYPPGSPVSSGLSGQNWTKANRAWTGTAGDGLMAGTAAAGTCGDWTSTADRGTYGLTTSTGVAWTNSALVTCADWEAFYCVEQ